MSSGTFFVLCIHHRSENCRKFVPANRRPHNWKLYLSRLQAVLRYAQTFRLSLKYLNWQNGGYTIFEVFEFLWHVLINLDNQLAQTMKLP